MKLYNIEYLPQMRYEVLGLVKGNVVRSKHIGRDIMAALKNIVGGELVGYTEMLSEARDIATQRMAAEACAVSTSNCSYSSVCVPSAQSEMTRRMPNGMPEYCAT